ncbi:hypothetical protein GJ688_12875 [Heliobacillus mobilis]|uniref:Uncharacterized protein n=1 Tax=Heliobacterium mobile TaxID=28064 RepID=A0A6I3SM70_HELMO|nr:hypothetical protein [Heliobacterium mobile]MTV49866.1 hypothetical protein [Heliobacterium mobile]
MTRSTDVPASIAGYYFQILLACRELVLLCNGNLSDKVILEKGADIKLVTGNNTCIESKFYKDEYFTRNHKSVRHTIYNFYNDFKSNLTNGKPVSRYIYKTNVKIAEEDRLFFDKWNTTNFTTKTDCQEYIKFIRYCVVYESVIRTPYKSNFEHFKKLTKRKFETITEYLDILLLHLDTYPNDIGLYCDAMVEKDVINFINTVRFQFFVGSSNKKRTAINNIKNEINYILTGYSPNLTIDDCNKIRHKIMEDFYDTIVDANDNNGLSVKDLLFNINNHHMIKQKHFDNTLISMFCNVYEEKIDELETDLIQAELMDDFDGIRSTFIQIVEKFFECAKNISLDVISKTIIIGPYPYEPFIILDLIKALSVLVYYKKVEIDSISFFYLNGINNISLKNIGEFCLKGTPNSRHTRNVNALVTAFIEDILKKATIPDGNEKIVFNVDSRNCRLCMFKKEGINDILSNIGSCYTNRLTQELLQSLDFKCTECLKIEQNSTFVKDNLDKFMEDNCNDTSA